MKDIFRVRLIRECVAITIYGLVVTMMISCAQTGPQIAHLPVDMPSLSEDDFLE
jgi:hypothetical protein